jgi:hypothetical protein
MKKFAAQVAQRLLIGTVESIARAGAKFVESVTHDAQIALRNEATKLEVAQHTVEGWRKITLGDLVDMRAVGRSEKKE